MTITSTLLASITKSVCSAGNLILQRPSFEVTQKEGHANFVTDIDCAVEAFLIRELTSLLPASASLEKKKKTTVFLQNQHGSSILLTEQPI